jgi:RimJ/RimL family protein N-acetyltransferase
MGEFGELEMANKSILLRQWKGEDIGPFAEMNADREVMRILPKVLTRAESKGSWRSAAQSR